MKKVSPLGLLSHRDLMNSINSHTVCHPALALVLSFADLYLCVRQMPISRTEGRETSERDGKFPVHL